MDEAGAGGGPRLAGGQPVLSHDIFKVKKARGNEAVPGGWAEGWCSHSAAMLERESEASVKAGVAGGEAPPGRGEEGSVMAPPVLLGVQQYCRELQQHGSDNNSTAAEVAPRKRRRELE